MSDRRARSSVARVEVERTDNDVAEVVSADYDEMATLDLEEAS